MPEERYKRLIKSSEEFDKKFEEIPINLASYRKKVGLYEDVKHLAKINELLDAKILRFKTEESVIVEEKDRSDVKTNELLQEFIKKDNLKNVINQVGLGGKIMKLLGKKNEENQQEDYKKLILNEVSRISDVNDTLNQVCREQCSLTQQIVDLKFEVKLRHDVYKEQLKESRQKNEDLSKQSDSDIAQLEKRIEKINFMRSLIKQLILMSASKDTPMEIFEEMRDVISLDCLKDST